MANPNKPTRQNPSKNGRSGIPTERLALRFQLDPADDPTAAQAGEFSGYAAVFNEMVDAFVPTVFEPGSFAKTIKESGDRVRLLWQHDRYEPIGKILELREDEKGLHIRAKLSDTSRGRDALALLRDAALDEMSVGIDPIRWEMEQDENDPRAEPTRRLQEVRLPEISLVTFGAAGEPASVDEVHEQQTTTPDPDNPQPNSDPTLAHAVETAAAKARLELHAGEVLSETDLPIVTDAIAALQDLIQAAEPPESDEQNAAQPLALTATWMDLHLAELKQAEALDAKAHSRRTQA